MRSVHRLARSTALVLAGCAIGSLAVGAARPTGLPGEMRIGDVGVHRGQEDSLIFNLQGRNYRIRYSEWAAPQKDGMVQFRGTVYAQPWTAPPRIEEKLKADGDTRRGVVGPQIQARPRGLEQAPEGAEKVVRRGTRN